MWTEPRPLTNESPTEVPLPRAPLERVIAQIRFPQILAIRNPDRVANFQEEIRNTYPVLSKDQGHGVNFGPETPEISELPLIWRFASSQESPPWQVSLGVDFIALEATKYESRSDFLDRLDHIVARLADAFSPSEAQRVGLRYIDRLRDEALDHLPGLIQPEVLGILQTNMEARQILAHAAIHSITNAQFLAKEGVIQGLWGMLPPNATYDPNMLQPVEKASWFLDLDMFTTNPIAYERKLLSSTLESFAKRIYTVFRQMTTEEFLAFYGAES